MSAEQEWSGAMDTALCCEEVGMFILSMIGAYIATACVWWRETDDDFRRWYLGELAEEASL